MLMKSASQSLAEQLGATMPSLSAAGSTSLRPQRQARAGALFHAVRKPGTLMRINFATTQEAAFWKVFARLRDSVR